MTTDTRPKGASRQIDLDGHTVSISGISKGAGMIRPNMATMLGFIATDAKIAPDVLSSLATELGEKSFNRITIDGDTSTNDACMLIASGQYSGPEITADSPCLPELRETLREVFLELAHAIVRDGEGATKFVTIEVSRAGTVQEALDVAYTVAHSPLVKTALFASDPNWGRILAAVGRAGVDGLDLGALEIWLGDVCLVRNGGRADDYSESRGQAVMNGEEITIHIDLKRGDVMGVDLRLTTMSPSMPSTVPDYDECSGNTRCGWSYFPRGKGVDRTPPGARSPGRPAGISRWQGRGW